MHFHPTLPSVIVIARFLGNTVGISTCSLALDFDVGKAADWVDTEGHVGIVGKAVRVTVVQKEIAPLEEYGRYVSVTFNVTCTVEKHGPCWEVRPLAPWIS